MWAMRCFVCCAWASASVLASSSTSVPTPSLWVKSSNTDQWLVVYRPEAQRSVLLTSEENNAVQKLKARGRSFDFSNKQQHSLIRGFTGNFTKSEIESIRNSSDIMFIEPNMQMSVQCINTTTTQWNMERIFQESEIYDGTYMASTWQGDGVDVYVVDTGINPHPEFEDRLSRGFDAVNDGNFDPHSHGTHVAGIIGSKTYGVAKKASIIDVRVLNADGKGSVADIISGLNYVWKRYMDQPVESRRPTIINNSLGGNKSEVLNEVLRNLIGSGIHVVVAAGNEQRDACLSSPASADGVVAVGSTGKTDTRSGFSNYGSCVTLFAPGEFIVSVSNVTRAGDSTDTITKSGTSQAAPHVSGIAAILLSQNSTLTPADLKRRLVQFALPNQVKQAKGPASLVHLPCNLVTPAALESAPSGSGRPSWSPSLTLSMSIYVIFFALCW